MENSILKSIRNSIVGTDDGYDGFDKDLLTFINSTFSTLSQIGVGPEEGFTVESEDENWTDFVSDPKILNMVKAYVLDKVRVQFDPPTSSFVLDSLNKNIAEYEWRLNIEVDPGKSK
jgi:hypothetical protein